MMLLAFMAFFGIGLLIPILKLFAMDELHLSETGFGILVLPIALVVGISSIALGNLGDRWGKARSVRTGIMLAAAAMWGVTISHTAWQFAVAGILLGTGFVMAMPAWLALVADIAAPKARGAVIGALGTAQGVGAAVGAYVGPKLYDMQAVSLAGVPVDPQYAPFIVSAATLTVCVVLGFIFVKDNETRRIGH
jgi:MFS family permease